MAHLLPWNCWLCPGTTPWDLVVHLRLWSKALWTVPASTCYTWSGRRDTRTERTRKCKTWWRRRTKRGCGIFLFNGGKVLLTDNPYLLLEAAKYSSQISQLIIIYEKYSCWSHLSSCSLHVKSMIISTMSHQRFWSFKGYLSAGQFGVLVTTG